jgi:hypothetical protein
MRGSRTGKSRRDITYAVIRGRLCAIGHDYRRWLVDISEVDSQGLERLQILFDEALAEFLAYSRPFRAVFVDIVVRSTISKPVKIDQRFGGGTFSCGPTFDVIAC